MSLDMSRNSHLEQVGHCVLVQLKLSCNSHLEQVGHHVLVQLNLSCNTGGKKKKINLFLFLCHRSIFSVHNSFLFVAITVFVIHVVVSLILR